MYYYDVTFPANTSGTTLTLSTHLRFLTAATLPIRLVGLYGSAKGTAAGGGVLKATRATATLTGGTAIAAPNGINKRNPADPTAGVAVTTAPTTGTGTLSTQLNIGFAQTGGQGGWVALDPDHALKLLPAAGATGNLEIGSLAVGTSIPIEITAEFSEG